MFTYVTTISTVLFLVVWALIIVAYINYSRKNPELHKATYKLPGRQFMGYAILIFFIFVFALLFVNVDTRRAIYITPVWFFILGLMYLRYRKESKHA